MNGRRIRIFLVEDQRLPREALALLLQARGGFEVVGQSEAQAALERIPALDPDVAVVDLSERDALDAVRRLREHHPRTEVVALSDRGHEALHRQAFEAGVRGWVPKEEGFDRLADAVRAAARGDYTLGGDRDLGAEYAQPWVARQRPGGVLTPREREVAVLLADGYSSKEAAAVLDISVRTADTHRASLMRKLDARNVADVVKYCIRNGLIGL